MKNGEIYGLMGRSGSAATYLAIYSELEQQLVASNISEAKRQQQLTSVALQYDKLAARTLSELRKQRGSVLAKNKLSYGVISQFYITQLNLIRAREALKEKASKGTYEGAQGYADAKQEVEQAFNYKDTSEGQALIVDISTALSTADSASVLNRIDKLIESETDKIKSYSANEVGEQYAHILHLKNQILSETTEKNLSLDEETLNAKLETALNVNIENLNQQYIDEQKQKKLDAIPEPKGLSADITALDTLEDKLQGTLDSMGGTSKDAKKAAEVFSSPALRALFDLQDATNYAPTREQVQNLLNTYQIEPEVLSEQYEKAKGYLNTNIELVPQDYLDNLSNDVVQNRQMAAQYRQPRTETATPDLEQLAAQRFLMTQQRSPLSMTRAESKQIDYDSSLYGRGQYQLDERLKSDENFRTQFQSYSPEKQAFAHYGVAATDFYNKMGVDTPKPKGRAQKLAMQLYDADSELDAAQIIQKTSEMFTNKENLDEARAYYAALAMNGKRTTRPAPETVDASNDIEPYIAGTEDLSKKKSRRKRAGIAAGLAFGTEVNPPETVVIENNLEPMNENISVSNRTPDMMDNIFSLSGTTTDELSTLPLTEQEAILKYLQELDTEYY